MTLFTREQVEWVDEETATAFSRDRYSSWDACIRLLLRNGWSPAAAAGLLNSKHTRWAGDSSERRYGRVTSGDLKRYLGDLLDCPHRYNIDTGQFEEEECFQPAEWSEDVRRRLRHATQVSGASTAHASDIASALERIRALEAAADSLMGFLDPDSVRDQESDPHLRMERDAAEERVRRAIQRAHS